ncbi:MAG: universal stress protein [Nitrospiraceae bacterium]|nr:universal stress protein [Nitrospiraceae bacterium]
MKILLATDGSEQSEKAARFITRFELTSEDEVIVFNAINWLPFQEDRESFYKNLTFLRQEIAGKVLDSAVHILEPIPARVKTASKEGFADKVILEEARESDADLIVMGARGLKGVSSFLLGSVTRRAAIQSPKPLLIVKNGGPAADKAKAPLKVLLATDGSDSARAAARFLTSMPLSPKTEIRILNVTWSAVSDIPERYIIEVDELVKQEIERAREKEYSVSGNIIRRARSELDQKFKNISETIRIGDPAQEIIAETQAWGADMVVAGCRGLRGIAGIMGSVSRRILDHVKCAVLLGRMCAGKP